MIAIQRGENKNYPYQITTWKIGEKIPEWLSDQAKVKFIDGEGNLTLDWLETSTGGLEIQDSSGLNVLTRLKTKDSILCYSSGTNKIFSLTPVQFNLLYQSGEE